MKFRKKASEVEAIQVTPENVESLLEIPGISIILRRTYQHQRPELIRVELRTADESDRVALPGQWVLLGPGKEPMIMTDRDFRAEYETGK